VGSAFSSRETRTPGKAKQRVFLRSREADLHLEIFLSAAVASVLGIRFFLKVTGYPQLSGGGLHIAHMLWGGLFMLASLGMLLAFLDRGTARLAALIGGLGFGTFIDEIGKFVTQDTNYFYRPAVALIYIAFVLVVLAAQAISRRLYTREENLVNALQEIEELALWNLDARERRRALRLLDASDPTNPLVPALRALLVGAPLTPLARPGWYTRARTGVHRLYEAHTRHPRFRAIVVAIFAGQLLVKLTYVVLVIFFPWTLPTPEGYPTPPHVVERLSDLNAIEWVQLGSAVFSGVLVAIGLAGLTRSRTFAYRNLKRSLLVGIFLTQVFVFYDRQFDALIGLVVNLLLLAAVQAGLDLEAWASRRDSIRRSGTSHMSATDT
jgi:hypothetical protein